MTARPRRPPLSRPAAWRAAVCGVFALAAGPAWGQGTAGLANRAEKLQQQYVRGALELAGEFEAAGDPDGAIALLQSVRRAAPDAPGVDERLRALEEGILSAGETTLTLDAPLDWTPVARVREGGSFRAAVDGSYRLTLSGTVPPSGLPPGEAAAGFVPDLPLGALIGAYVEPRAARANPRGRRGDDRRGGDDPEAFALAGGDAGPAGGQFTADTTGLLLVRLNLPPGCRAVGKLKLTLSGQVAAAPAR